MNILDLRYQLEMPTQAGQVADIHIQLDLTALSGLDSEDPASDLQRRGDEIRRELFVQGRKIVADIAEQTGAGEIVPPDYSLDSRIRVDNERFFGEVLEGEVLSTRNALDIHCSFTADRIMDPATMLYIGKEGVASFIADSLMFDLERIHLGKESSRVKSQWDAKNPEASYQVMKVPETLSGSQ